MIEVPAEDHYEYERRWLVSDPSVLLKHHPTVVTQAYLLLKDGWTVRVRRAFTVGPTRPQVGRGYNTLAIKGPRRDARRLEVEEPISADRAEELFNQSICRVAKSRFQLVEDGFTWDVDWFHLENEGLVIAECETAGPEQDIPVPLWCGEEVTDDARFDNENLACNPFLHWPLE